ncbi:MAG TPA: DNA replication/repair protein RecF [Rubrobacter sp.]|nr:DNA replication/repair protein RecF [Rubrobacter sp.]
MSAYLRALRLVNFRNYVDATALLAPGLNVVVGDNAQGKTNLLEAVAFNVTGSSPRTPKENEVVRWGSDFTRTEARIALDGSLGERDVAIGYAPGQKKRITVDGVPAPSLTNFSAGGAGARVVTFFPDDMRVVKGAPADRREFLDALLSSLRPAYARAAVEYARAIQQRNQLLRRIRDGFSSERTLATWDRKVVELGKTVLAGREAALPVLEEHFIDALSTLYGPEKAAIRYGHSSTLEEYSEALRVAHSADVERGTTSVGPHRDDFEVTLGGVNLTTFGSQGQQRIATLALKFASRDYVRGAVGEDPILLFDDVMSELDERRREYLAGYFLESTQAVISTTNLEYFDEEILRRTRIIRISGGSILENATDGARR